MKKDNIEHFSEDIQGWFSFPNLYKAFVEHFPKDSHFVEVGAWLGKSASFMAVEINNSKKDIKFDCVDTWGGSEDLLNEDGLLKFDWTKHDENGKLLWKQDFLMTPDELYEKFLENVKPVKHVINPIKMESIEASKLYKDASLDVVFIDGAHDFDNVQNDIKAWLPKVKVGGYIAGHDYSWDPEVRRAVHTVFNTIDQEVEGCWVKLIKS